MKELGKSGILVSPMAMGCWSFGGGAYWGAQSQKDVDCVVGAALDRGVNLFDTAEMYNAGESERSLGLALKGRRNEAVVASKVGPDNAYYDTLLAHCDASLKRLGTDYLDVYMLHWPINLRAVMHFTSDPEKLSRLPSIEEVMAAMTELKKRGRIRSIGISNFGVGQMREAIATGAQIDVNEMPYNIFSRAIEKDIQPFCVENGVSILCSMALQQGLLAGKYRSADEVPMNQAHSRHYRADRGQGTSRHGGQGAEEEMFAALPMLKEIAESFGVTLPQMAIAWTLHRAGVVSTLVGCRNIRQLDENILSVFRTLPDEAIEKIDAVSQSVLDKLGSNPDYYESDENSRIW